MGAQSVMNQFVSRAGGLAMISTQNNYMCTLPTILSALVPTDMPTL